MNSKLIEYTPEQIEKACESGDLVYVSLSDRWSGVTPVILVKHTAKCIFPKNTSSARFEKDRIGSEHWGGVYCIKGDEWTVMEEYYNRMQAKFKTEMASLQKRYDDMHCAKVEKAIADYNPEIKKYVMRDGSETPVYKFKYSL
jgi:hypothetical protein